MRLPIEKNTTDISAMQVHKEVEEIARTFKEIADHVGSSSEEYATKGSDVKGEIDDQIHSKMEKNENLLLV